MLGKKDDDENSNDMNNKKPVPSQQCNERNVEDNFLSTSIEHMTAKARKN